jgi:ABC-type lipoprotein export system ATPase subunit
MKVYRMGEVEVHALRSVDIDLYESELLVLLGASGSGKSTLLNILAGSTRRRGARVITVTMIWLQTLPESTKRATAAEEIAGCPGRYGLIRA